MDLSILIPSRNEEWLSETLEDLLKNIRGNTEIIVVLDGAPEVKPLPVDPRITVIRYMQSVGQRAATNAACRLSRAKYVMKVDAHCAFDEGFDLKLMADMQDDWTVVPVMRNLHIFDWVCKNGHRRYQSPSGPCTICNAPTEKDVVWIPKLKPESYSYRFDTTLHFQYHREHKHHPLYKTGVLLGYNLSFPSISVTPSIVGLLTELADSHQLSSSLDTFRSGQYMTSDAVRLSFVDGSGGVRPQEVFSVGNELQVERITAPSILTQVVEDRNILSSASGEWANQPSVSQTVSQCFLSESSTPTITTNINTTHPIPTTGDTINSDILNKFNSVLGGQFVYNEKTSSYHNESVTLTPIYDKQLTETMSLQGSCFMLTRDKYWELNICDEEFGSWGAQGTEVACKTWLSGGKCIVNHKTWYGHLFRTQGGDFSFPYKQDNAQVERARELSRRLFLDNTWPLQKYPLSWLVDRFAPVPGWHDGTDNGMLARIREWGEKMLE